MEAFAFAAIFFAAFGPWLWAVLAIWCVARQATGTRLSLGIFLAAAGAQAVVIGLPFAIYHLSLKDAGLSGSTGCLNGPKLSEACRELEALQGDKRLHLAAAFWIGSVVWISVIYARSRLRTPMAE